MDTRSKRARFFELHQGGCFLLPNPWDVGSAKLLESMGFQAVASTSSGAALAIGLQDGELTREQVLQHLETLCRATSLPVNADFEDGFGDDANGVLESVQLAIGTGIAGVSIEDSDGSRLLPMDKALDRLRAAREAIDRSGEKVVLVGRSEGYIRNHPDLGDTIERLVAYKKAGADCLYAPGLKELNEIKKIVEAVAPAPVNGLLLPGMTVAELKSCGVRRVSVGGAFAKAAYGALRASAAAFMGEGTLR